MGTMPSGYQTPKTNWVAGDVPSAADFNRIEGNTLAIETGLRTIDPSQALTSNSGSLRQLLDGFAFQLKNITGKPNWFDTPDISLSDVQRTVTFTVAAKNSLKKQAADFICDGVKDQEEINAALNAATSTGGTVLLLEGTFIIDGPIMVPSYTSLVGQGKGTIIQLSSGIISNVNMIQNADQTNGNTQIVLRDFAVKSNQTGTLTATSVFLYLVTDSIVANVLTDSGVDGIILLRSSNNIIVHNICRNGWDGIAISFDSHFNIVADNICYGNWSARGIQCLADNNTIRGNICTNNIIGINIHANNNMIANNICRQNSSNGITCETDCHNNAIISNICSENGNTGIYLYNSSENVICNNICVANSQSEDSAFSNISLESSSYNNIQGNLCRIGTNANRPESGINISSSCDGNFVTNNDLYNSGAASNFINNGTNTITTSGNRI